MIWLLIFAVVLAFYVAWNIGANDVANAMGTSVGSGALTLGRAVALAAVLEVAGAFLLGSHVSNTVESGIVNPAMFAAEPHLYAYGMLAALLAAGIWLQVATYFGWPVSTTHSIVGAIIGFGIIAAGVHSIYWGQVLFIGSSWIISPLLGGCIGFLTFNIIRRQIFYKRDPIAAAKRIAPWLLFVVFGVLSLVLLYDGMEGTDINLSFWPALGASVLIGLIAAGVGAVLTRRIKQTTDVPESRQGLAVLTGLERGVKHLRRARNEARGGLSEEMDELIKRADHLVAAVGTPNKYELLDAESRTVERMFVFLQIISACFMAFAHGANDVANAIGPLSAVVEFARTGLIGVKSPVPLWLLGVGGAGIVIGLATWGWRVIRTVGKRITELTPTRGFSAEFGAALTILVASRLGLPVSTTHTLVGAVFGVGLARGIGAINLRIIRDIVVSWVITIPAGALLAILFYKVFLYLL
jgi:PiT family inorganic phosphate transporter